MEWGCWDRRSKARGLSVLMVVMGSRTYVCHCREVGRYSGDEKRPSGENKCDLRIFAGVTHSAESTAHSSVPDPSALAIRCRTVCAE